MVPTRYASPDGCCVVVVADDVVCELFFGIMNDVWVVPHAMDGSKLAEYFVLLFFPSGG